MITKENILAARKQRKLDERRQKTQQEARKSVLERVRQHPESSYELVRYFGSRSSLKLYRAQKHIKCYKDICEAMINLHNKKADEKSKLENQLFITRAILFGVSALLIIEKFF